MCDSAKVSGQARESNNMLLRVLCPCFMLFYSSLFLDSTQLSKQSPRLDSWKDVCAEFKEMKQRVLVREITVKAVFLQSQGWKSRYNGWNPSGEAWEDRSVGESTVMKMGITTQLASQAELQTDSSPVHSNVKTQRANILKFFPFYF